MPSSWKLGGILMSVTTTSGWCSLAAARSVGASSATPTTSIPSVAARRALTPSRTSTLSSPNTTRIVMTLLASSGPPCIPSSPMAIRVVFAEDNYLVREGTAALLAGAGEVDLVATVEDLESLLAAVEEHRPDAVLTDIRMPPSNTTEGIDAARRIRADHPDTG